MPNVFFVKLKLLAARFLNLQLYLLQLHHLMEEGSGTNTWTHKSKENLVQGHPLGPEAYEKSKTFKRIVFQ